MSAPTVAHQVTSGGDQEVSKSMADALRLRAIQIPDDKEAIIMKIFRASICVLLLAAAAGAQQDNPPVEPMDQTPVFRVNVVSRTTKAVNYRHRGGSTTVDIKGTSLMPEASGKAKVDSKAGRLQINVELSQARTGQPRSARNI